MCVVDGDCETALASIGVLSPFEITLGYLQIDFVCRGYGSLLEDVVERLRKGKCLVGCLSDSSEVSPCLAPEADMPEDRLRCH